MDDELKKMLTHLLGRVEEVITVQIEHGKRLGRVEEKLQAVEVRLSAVEVRLHVVEVKLQAVEVKLQSFDGQIRALTEDVERVKHVAGANHYRVMGSIDRVASMLAEHMADTDGHIPHSRRAV